MSNDDNKLKEVPAETVVITPDDVKGAAEFWTHFQVPMAAELKLAFDKFVEQPTVANQREVKLRLTEAIAYTDHEAFKDEMFNEIVEECRQVAYNMSFEKTFEKVLTNDASEVSSPDKA